MNLVILMWPCKCFYFFLFSRKAPVEIISQVRFHIVEDWA